MTTLTEPVYNAIRQHALSKPTQEVCGLISHTGSALRTHQLRNISQTPETHYAADVAEAVAMLGDETLVGVYHSHVDMAPYPSPTDITMWQNGELLLVIYSVLADETCCYRIVDGEVLDVG